MSKQIGMFKPKSEWLPPQEFKNIKDAQPGDTFVVKTTVKDPDTGTEKILKSIIEIDLDGTPQRIYNIA